MCAFVCLMSFAGFGQTVRSLTELGTRAENDGDWYAAAHYYHQAFALDSSNFDATVRYAESLRHIKEYPLAAYYYSKAFEKDRGKLFPEGQFYLASMEQQSGNYLNALKHFEKYLKKNKRNKESATYLRAQQGIKGCTYALNARRDAGWMDIHPLGAPVNTTQSEFAPWLLQDSTLFYAALHTVALGEQPAIQNFQGSLLPDSSWTAEGGSWSPFAEAPFQQGNATIGPYGKRLYVSACTEQGICTLCMAEKTGSSWGKAKPLSSVNASGYSSTMPHVALIGDREVLFFASNRPGSKGGYDIWWSEMSNGIPAPPVNAGSTVNSPEDEITPFYTNGTLYFSSAWHAGFGGFDVFKSSGKPRSLGLPENMGFPLNSAQNDLYFRYFPFAAHGLMASNRPGSLTDKSATCCNDIFRVDFSDSTRAENQDPVFASLEELNRYLPVTLYFHNDEPDPNSRDTTASVTYQQAYDSYSQLEGQYVKENTKGLDGEAKEDGSFEVASFFDFKVDKGRNDLDLFMPLLLQELQAGTSVELQVRGFASPRAKSDYNVNLTKRRISSLELALRGYQGGILLPYFQATRPNGAVLKVTALPFGEYQADQSVSDALEDEQASIYSQGARLERKIVVESVQRVENPDPKAVFSPDKRVHDFGPIDARYPVSRTFTLRNSGDATLSITKVESECGCTVPELLETEIPPGESTTLTVTFDPEGKSGLVTKTVTVWIAGQDEPQRITITAHVR